MKNIFFTLIILFFVACSSKETKEVKPDAVGAPGNIVHLSDAQAKSAQISTLLLEKSQLSSVLKLNGKIDVPPQNMVSISMPLGGYLKSTKLLPGMHLLKGEIIAVMEDRQYIALQQEYLNAQSKLVYDEQDYKRQLELNQSKASSDKVLQQAEMQLKTQKINLAALAEQLKLININPQTLNENNLSKSVNIYSPINGFVSAVKVNVGKYLNPSDVMFELVNPEDIHLNLNVFEKDLNKLAIGQKLMAYTNNEPDKKHPCEIILISKDVTAGGTAEVHCHFEDYDKTLLPGMYMNAAIEISNHEAFTIPEEAVINFEGKDYVFVSLSKNKFEMKEVKTGVKENGRLEIINASDFQGKSVVVKGAYTLLMSLKNSEE
jgi:membrane fusion protein, heavy metal efflux system